MGVLKDSTVNLSERTEFTKSGDKIVILKLKNNKLLHIMSTACGSESSNACDRWSKEKKGQCSFIHLPKLDITRM